MDAARPDRRAERFASPARRARGPPDQARQPDHEGREIDHARDSDRSRTRPRECPRASGTGVRPTIAKRFFGPNSNRWTTTTSSGFGRCRSRTCRRDRIFLSLRIESVCSTPALSFFGVADRYADQRVWSDTAPALPSILMSKSLRICTTPVEDLAPLVAACLHEVNFAAGGHGSSQVR